MVKKSKTKKEVSSPEQQYKVSGQVLNSTNEFIASQGILAVDVDLKGAAIYRTVTSVRAIKATDGFDLLGTATTDADGFYEVVFTNQMYQRNELGLADVVVFAVDGDKIIARSKLTTQKDYIKSELTHWDIQLPDASKRGVSEYTRLIQVLGPFVKENGLQLFQLSVSADQVDFLATETQQDQSHTSLAVQADQLRNDSSKRDLSAELFYGIGRQQLALTWIDLLQESAADLQAAIERSIAQNIISPQDPKAVDRFIRNLMTVALQHSTIAPETTDFYKAIGFSVKDAALQSTFAQTYLQYSGTPGDFWSALSQKPGFTPQVIQGLQLTNQLHILTGQNTGLVEALQVNRGIKDPSDLLQLSTGDWNKIIGAVGVPDSVPGDTPKDKTSNYITGMQTLLNAAYPTRKIGLMIDNNQLPISDANVKGKVSAFLKAAQAKGFDISVSRATDFESTLKEVAGNLFDQVLQQVRLIQRVYQISPTPKAMNVLLAKGYGSAYQIASMPQNTFINTTAVDLGGADVALSVYNRARHQVMRAQHTLLKVRDTQDPTTPSKIITPVQRNAIGDYLDTLSTQQS